MLVLQVILTAVCIAQGCCWGGGVGRWLCAGAGLHYCRVETHTVAGLHLQRAGPAGGAGGGAEGGQWAVGCGGFGEPATAAAGPSLCGLITAASLPALLILLASCRRVLLHCRRHRISRRSPPTCWPAPLRRWRAAAWWCCCCPPWTHSHSSTPSPWMCTAGCAQRATRRSRVGGDGWVGGWVGGVAACAAVWGLPGCVPVPRLPAAWAFALQGASTRAWGAAPPCPPACTLWPQHCACCIHPNRPRFTPIRPKSPPRPLLQAASTSAWCCRWPPARTASSWTTSSTSCPHPHT